jgi:hypothetical protein
MKKYLHLTFLRGSNLHHFCTWNILQIVIKYIQMTSSHHVPSPCENEIRFYCICEPHITDGCNQKCVDVLDISPLKFKVLRVNKSNTLERSHNVLSLVREVLL